MRESRYYISTIFKTFLFGPITIGCRKRLSNVLTHHDSILNSAILIMTREVCGKYFIEQGEEGVGRMLFHKVVRTETHMVVSGW